MNASSPHHHHNPPPSHVMRDNGGGGGGGGSGARAGTTSSIGISRQHPMIRTRRVQSSPTAGVDRKRYHNGGSNSNSNSSSPSASSSTSPSNGSQDDSISMMAGSAAASSSGMMMMGSGSLMGRSPSTSLLRETSPNQLRALRTLRRRTRQQEARRLRRCASCLALALVGVTSLAYLLRSSLSSSSSASSHNPTSSEHRITTSELPGSSATGGALRSAAVTEVDPSSRFLIKSPGAPSCELLPDAAVEFTLVTQCSEDRLWMMEHHCQRWPGPISLAVYSNATRQELQLRLRDLRCGGRDGEMLTVRTVRADRPESDYPVNELRNHALAQVKTSHVVYVDIDFWTDTNLYDVLQLHVDALRDDPRLALVLPAFALRRQCWANKECPNRNIPRMPKTKDDILENLYNRTVTAFDPTNYGGHGSTHYVEWMDQEDDQLEMIDCVLSNRFEPYLVVRYCDMLPPFQPGFSGYGKNKMTWVMQLRRLGYRLGQLNSFVCHYPHLDSKARMAWQGTTEVGQRAPPRPQDPKQYVELKRGRNDQLFLDFKRWLHSSSVPDRTVVGMCDNHLDDDSKLWVDRTSRVAATSSSAAAAAAAL